MKEIPKKLLSIMMASVLTLSSVSLASAAESNGMPQDESIPEGYKVIKQYDINDDSTKVKTPLDITTKSQLNSENRMNEFSTEETKDKTVADATYNDYDIQSTNTETHIYRELQNIDTGTTMNQYVTDVATTATPGDRSTQTKDPNSDITLTMRLFYHSSSKGDGNTYLGLEKIYYRYDGTPDRSRVVGIDGTAIQWGPGIDGHAKTQEMALSKQLGYELGTTNLVNLQNKGWTEVLDGGLATQLGIQLTADISNNGFIHSFTSQFFINGRGPI